VIRKLINLALTLGLFAGLGYVLWIGMRKHREKPADSAATESVAAPADDQPAEPTVLLERERSEALAIAAERPRAFTLQATRQAFGSVIDPSPFITLDGDLAAAEAALAASRADHERTLALVATHDASKQSAEAAEARFLADRVKVDGIIRGAQLQWGAIFTSDTAKRRAFVNDLVSGSESLIRVDVMPGDALVEMPVGAQIVVIGREGQPIATDKVLPATVADPKTQAQGFILRVAKPPFTLRPGMALTAWLKLPDKERAGFVIPRSAVLRHDGRTWIYVRKSGGRFVRQPVALDTPLAADLGWFVAGDDGVAADDEIVGTGAASLLSEELKSQGGGESE